MIYEDILTMLSGLEIWHQRSRHWILSNLRVIWSKAKHSQAWDRKKEMKLSFKLLCCKIVTVVRGSGHQCLLWEESVSGQRTEIAILSNVSNVSTSYLVKPRLFLEHSLRQRTCLYYQLLSKVMLQAANTVNTNI